MINWKQPNYGVFFGTTCGYVAQEGPWGQPVVETDIRCNSIKEAIKFAKSSNLLGLICEAAPIVNY
jgi:CDK inhibitor PHO81